MKFARCTLLLVAALLPCQAAPDARPLPDQFRNPDVAMRPYVLWWLNGELTREKIDYLLDHIRNTDGFGGVAPLTLARRKPPTNPPYLSQDWIGMYRQIIESGKKNHLGFMYYDDCDFPSGVAGGLTKEKFPGDMERFLWQGKSEKSQGAGPVTVLAPEQKISCALAKDPRTNTFVDVTDKVKTTVLPTAEQKDFSCQPATSQNVNTIRGFLKQKIEWTAPDKDWILYVYSCPVNGETAKLNYLSPRAVKDFMSLTYDVMDKALKNDDFFGTACKSTFYDDLSMYSTPGGSSWSDEVDERFEKTYGASPRLYYPSLFYEDESSEADARRSMLLKTRSEQLSETYPRMIQEWCDRHGMNASGHPAGAYETSPLYTCGDVIVFYKHQNEVLFDYVHSKNQGLNGFKAATAAAINYDKQIVNCEIYGNFHPDKDNDGLMLYRGAIDAYTRGANHLVVHGSWLDENNVRPIPEISWRNPRLGKDLPAYTTWAARVETILRQGKHQADIAVLYPIRTLEAHHRFQYWGDARSGVAEYPELPHADYLKVGAILTNDLKSDFHFLHPDVLEQKCSVADRVLALETGNRQEFKALILPKCEYMSLGTMKKIREFADKGGLVIATGKLPSKSDNPAVPDAEIEKISREVFGGMGGIFLENSSAENLRKALDSKNATYNVRGTCNLGREVNCQHRELDGRHFYFTGNAGDQKADLHLEISGSGKWSVWNPHTGDIEPVHPKQDGNKALFDLVLDPGQARFLVRE